MHAPTLETGTESGARRGWAVAAARWIAFGLLGGGAVAGLGMMVGFAILFVQLSWPHVEPLSNPVFGINYSCNDAEYLLLEDPRWGRRVLSDDRPGRAEWCAETLGTILESGARYVRISVEWSQVEPTEGVYDFTLIDALLAEADRDGAKVLLGVGVKAQRHPEFYIPDWVMDGAVDPAQAEVISDDPYLHDQALAMVRAVVAHVKERPRSTRGMRITTVRGVAAGSGLDAQPRVRGRGGERHPHR